ncbi:MAG TPA: hypothetical protein VI011_05940 [Asanoa sp.]|jgi:hypothetical protein
MTYERWLAAVAEGVDEDREAAEPGVFARLREIFRGDLPGVTVQLAPDVRDLLAPIAR